MYAKSCTKLLEGENLVENAKLAVPAAEKIFRQCLNAKKEDVLILGDCGFENKRLSPILTSAYHKAAENLGLKSTLVMQEPKFRGDIADESIVSALKNLRRESIIVVAISSRIGSLKELGASYRTLAKEQGHRFVSATTMGALTNDQFSVLLNSIDLDYEKIQEKGRKLKELFDAGEEVHIKTDAGTDLLINIKGKTSISNTGEYTQLGTGGNIPCGEVYIPPKWKHVEGTVVIDGSSSYRYGTQLIKTPIKLTIEKDEVVNIEGGEEAKNLQETLDWAYSASKHPWGVRRVGELGIGINEKASIVGATVIDEKTLGTAHIAIGSNYWFGGTIYAKIHLDQIFRKPKIELDGKVLDV